ncbi:MULTISPECIES: ATPase [Tepidanaerobacter]|uniref:DNA repair protein RecN n=1 Tax=Tepidanaerobacter syntrophicus TaxID=224999 RepID=A0A0U9HQL1_9FIRM|nr:MULTISPECIES: ATPase [Tepidanaerobacter]GAQ26193.1 AAA ATPase domain-containing protein [Tepidanaerobacter syntrophicus]GLI19181.1 chromosome segregation ATPase [Tepidanaerobacter syntrophicus]GLI50187.1 chromosome segregation ATPase [Tepidanaerobacter syntrophicus]
MLEDLDRTINDIEKETQQLLIEFNVKKSIKEKLENDLSAKENELEEIRELMDVLEQVKFLLQRASEYAREQIKQQIEMLVTHCLQFVFGPNIEFQIELSEAANKTNAEFYVISDYDNFKVKTKPQDARGGGVVDVISLALRIAVIQSTNAYKNGPLILDEPAKHVSSEYIANVAQFLKQISDIFHRQIIMVTHNNYLSEIADAAYKVELKNGISDVTLVDEKEQNKL